jgi:hypothetical protein
MSHPSPLPPPTHLPMTWTPSSRPVPRFARLLHHTPLLLQVLRSLSSRHTWPRRPRPSHAWPQPAPRTAPTSLFAPRAASASRFTKPPWCTSNGIRPLCQSPLASGRRSTTPSSWLVTPAARTPWSPVVLSGSPSPWIVYSSPPPPLPRHCQRSRPLSVARSLAMDFKSSD